MRKNKNYWTKQKCFFESIKYKSRSEFKRCSCGAYCACLKNGWLDELCGHMNIFGNRFERLVYVYKFFDNSVYVGLTYNMLERDKKHKMDSRSVVYKHIKKTNSIPELQCSDYMHVESAKKTEKEQIKMYKELGFNVLNVANAGAVGGRYLKWNFEKCKEEALKCKTRKEFFKKNNSAYNSARKNNWLDKVCSHMVLKKMHKKGYWTKEMCKSVIEKYHTKSEIYKTNPGAYQAMLRNGWLYELCDNFKTKKPNGYWDKEKCKNEAVKYKTKSQFQKESSGAYRAMLRNKWDAYVCSHMEI